MDKSNELEKLDEIRTLMMRSSRFISLSGLSGVVAGLTALLGAAAAYFYLDMAKPLLSQRYSIVDSSGINWTSDALWFCLIDAALVLLISLTAGMYLTRKKAKKDGQQLLGGPAKRLAVSLLIPLAAGGAFCMILLYHGWVGLIAPSMLIFYGLALVSGSHYTLNEVRYLGILEIILGIAATAVIGYGLLFWAIGFGVLHILYGIVMYVRHEQ
ncbi:hypothetical protein [Halocola ammonii]